MGYRENLLNAIRRDSNHPINCGVPMQVHHLLSKKGASNGGVKSILEAYGYDINELGNLVALPCTLEGACHLEVQLHRGDHTSSSDDDDDEHPLSYHAHVSEIMSKAVDFIEKKCEKVSAEKVQSIMDKRSVDVLDDIKTFSIRLTRVHKSFKPEGKGCNRKSSIGELYSSLKLGNSNCDRDHKEFSNFPKKKYVLEVGK
ncbi:AHH domain-containing protein [Vibrio harveyi]|uniref:AHH domain-containing protein n=1 Tax=Vibrio harveyi TaxID=669 RepID=UPI002890CCD0|nr:AHH domain-containing protein [Vibrio harveyi]ELH4836258.1 AHH domain-containing protein [Vibrio harveyi]